jgi:Na+/H+ antiporter NhaD/arsenite permease-like protein
MSALLAPWSPDRTAAVIFVATYLVLCAGSARPLRLDRTGASLVGATAMVGFGVLTPREAIAAIDFRTLALLFGMMIVVAHLRFAGFFGWLARGVLARARHPHGLLLAVVLLSGVLSALFVNDTVCVLLPPLVFEITETLTLAPLPFLLAVAMGANAGSVATLVGNPQNMLVGSFSGIHFTRFALLLTPVAVVALAATYLSIAVVHARDLRPRPAPPALPPPRRVHRGMLIKSLLVSALLMAALLAGAPPGVAALAAASVLLLTRRINPRRVYAQVDWSLLTMFAGLFVVVEGLEKAGWPARLLAHTSRAHSLPALVAITAGLSNVVSNVPAVLLLKSWAIRFARPEAAWLGLAMASTLAGNLTLVGSVANLIVAEQARTRAPMGFWAYARVGVPLTLLTLVLGTLWLDRICR